MAWLHWIQSCLLEYLDNYAYTSLWMCEKKIKLCELHDITLHDPGFGVPFHLKGFEFFLWTLFSFDQLNMAHFSSIITAAGGQSNREELKCRWQKQSFCSSLNYFHKYLRNKGWWNNNASRVQNKEKSKQANITIEGGEDIQSPSGSGKVIETQRLYQRPKLILLYGLSQTTSKLQPKQAAAARKKPLQCSNLTLGVILDSLVNQEYRT